MWMLANVWVGLFATLFMLVCAFMILVILIQKPRGGGLSGAFGGGGGGAQAVFGAKVGDALTKFTIACFVAFLLLAMGLTWTIRPQPHLTGPAASPGDPTTTESPATQEAPAGAVSPQSAPQAPAEAGLTPPAPPAPESQP